MSPRPSRVPGALTWIALAACAVIGAAIGLGLFTFSYAKGSSYLGNDPATCANCHIMGQHYAAWRKSSHHAIAGCNDCHAPPGGLAKYWVKAKNGFNHSYAFTTGDFHEPLQITPSNRAVTEAQCRRCHADLVHQMGPAGDVACTRCHESVGHRIRD